MQQVSPRKGVRPEQMMEFSKLLERLILSLEKQ